MSDRRIESPTDLPAGTADAVSALIEAAAAQDGRPAVSEQGRLRLRHAGEAGVRHLLLWSGDTLAGYGQIDGSDPAEAPAGEFVVHPAHRARGHGRALGEAMLAATGGRLRVWAHGGHPAARRLAVRLGLTLFRELRQMRRPLDREPAGLPEARLPEGVAVRTFVPGRDESAWLAVNAAAFAHHPEQGSLTLQDLEDREAEPWFDPAGFFLAFLGEELAGFHWTKVHVREGLGEVYVVGVAPNRQAGGLGRALTVLGLRHLAADPRVRTAMLYVDADNEAAVGLYSRLGFTLHESDLMYRTES